MSGIDLTLHVLLAQSGRVGFFKGLLVGEPVSWLILIAIVGIVLGAAVVKSKMKKNKPKAD